MLFLYLIITHYSLITTHYSFVDCDIGACLHKPVEANLVVPFYRLSYFPNLLEGVVLTIFLKEVRHVFFRNHQHAILWQHLVKLLDLIAQIEVEAEEMQHIYRYIRIEFAGIKLLLDNRRQMLICLRVEHRWLQTGVEHQEESNDGGKSI